MSVWGQAQRRHTKPQTGIWMVGEESFARPSVLDFEMLDLVGESESLGMCS